MTTRLLPLALAVVACQATNVGQDNATLTAAQRDAIADTVRKLTSDYFAAMQNVEADKTAALESRSRDYAFLAQDGSICRTPEPCQQQTKDGWKDLKSMEIHIDDAKIAVASPTVAVATMRVGGSIFPKSGKTIVIDKAGITMVWVREVDGWKVLTFHQSYLQPTT